MVASEDEEAPEGDNFARIVQKYAVDVIAPAGDTGQSITQKFPMRQAPSDKNDFMVQVRASSLRRCRTRLQSLSTSPVNWSDLFLALATLGLGAYLGALASAVKWDSSLGVWLLAFSPGGGAAFFVAFLFSRKASQKSAKEAADFVLEELPEPDVTLPVDK